jgi:hypothetical protein
MQTQEAFVLDCSVTMAWCFDDSIVAEGELGLRPPRESSTPTLEW